MILFIGLLGLFVIVMVNYHINRLLKSMVTAKIPISFDSFKDWMIGIFTNPNLKWINILMLSFFITILVYLKHSIIK